MLSNGRKQNPDDPQQNQKMQTWLYKDMKENIIDYWKQRMITMYYGV